MPCDVRVAQRDVRSGARLAKTRPNEPPRGYDTVPRGTQGRRSRCLAAPLQSPFRTKGPEPRRHSGCDGVFLCSPPEHGGRRLFSPAPKAIDLRCRCRELRTMQPLHPRDSFVSHDIPCAAAWINPLRQLRSLSIHRGSSPFARTDQCFNGISDIGIEVRDAGVDCSRIAARAVVPTTLAERPLSARSLLRTLRLALRHGGGRLAPAPRPLRAPEALPRWRAGS